MQFAILGALEVTGEGGRVKLPPGRARTLLLLLLTTPNEPRSVDAITDELWGDTSPPSAPKIVQGYVGQLRRALGADRIETRGHAYLIRLEDGELDVQRVRALLAESRGQLPDERAETLRHALAYFRGRALDDAADEPFATAERNRLDELRMAVLVEQVETEHALGRPADLPELERAAAEHPLDERVRGLLMVALYRSGRQADALAEYADIRRLLTDDLGLDPSEELRLLQRRILEHAPDLHAHERGETPGETSAREKRHVRWWIVLPGAAALVAAALTALVLLTRPGEAQVVVPADSLAVIDAVHNRVVAAVPVGGRPRFVAAGAGAVWVANVNDRTVSRVDPETLRVTATIGLGFEPTDVAADDRHVWVVGGYDHEIWRIDTDGVVRVKASFVERLDALPEGSERGAAGVALSPGHVWLTHGDELSDIDPATGTTRSSIRAGGRWQRAIAATDGTVWVGFNDTARTLPGTRTAAGEDSPRLGPDPRVDVVSIAGVVVDGIALSSAASEIIVASGAVWIAQPIPGLVSQLVGDRVLRTVPAGYEPVGLAFADDALWATNHREGVVLRLNVRSGQIEAVLDIGHFLEDADAVGDRVFVAVR